MRLIVGVFIGTVVEQFIGEGLTGGAVGQDVFQIDQPGEVDFKLGVAPAQRLAQFPAAEAEGATGKALGLGLFPDPLLGETQ